MKPRIYLSPPCLTGQEEALVREVFASNWIAPLGPMVDGFEQDACARLGVAHAAALSSGTAALHLAFILLGLEPGEEVLVSTLTFSATVNAIVYEGGVPVFVDSSPDSWCLDPRLVADELDRCAARGRSPRAVLPVDIYGQCADYDPILAACRRRDVYLVEDAAEALGADYRGRPAGSFGDLSILSFNGNKIITTSGGGMLLSNRKEWIDKARFLATQAREPAPHYEHKEIGYNYRMSNVLAAIGRAQLRDLDRRVERRRRIFEIYQERLGGQPGIAFMPEASYGRGTRWLSCVTIDPVLFGADRETVRLALERDNIESRPVWKPMHLQPVFAACRFVGTGVSDRIFENGLCLPSGTGMTDDDLDRVAEIIVGCRG